VTLALRLAWVAALPALYSLLSALWHAFFGGEVMVIAIGWTGIRTELVPWPRGWARFAGPVLLLFSLLACGASRGATLRCWAAGVAAATALVLLGQSAWFTTVHGTMVFALFGTWMAAVFAVAYRLGRTAAILFILLSAGSFLWRFVGSDGVPGGR
jgi:hypothetical protein